MKKTIRWQGSAAEAGSLERLGVCKIGKICQSLQKHLGRPVPCGQGAANLLAATTAADPMIGGFEAQRLRGLERLAGQARSQKVKGSKSRLRAQTQAPKQPLHKEASRLGEASGPGS